MPWTHLPPHRPGWYWHVGPHAGAPDELEAGAGEGHARSPAFLVTLIANARPLFAS